VTLLNGNCHHYDHNVTFIGTEFWGIKMAGLCMHAMHAVADPIKSKAVNNGSSIFGGCVLPCFVMAARCS